MPENTHPTRRQVLTGGAIAGAGLLFGASAFSPGRANADFRSRQSTPG